MAETTGDRWGRVRQAHEVELYFDGLVDARICWGSEGRARGRKRSTIKLGSYSAQEQLIRIHPRLDQPFVPRYFISFVIFHEMLHHVMPATRYASRQATESTK